MKHPIRFLFGGLLIGLAVVAGWTLQRAGSAPFLSRIDPVVSASGFLSEGECQGDSNLDGVRDIRDVVLILAHILRRNPLDGPALSNADTNQDSQVDVLDIVDLFRHQLEGVALADCEPVFPCFAPSIRNIVPSASPPGGTFTLLGRGFSPVSSQNTVVLLSLNRTVEAQVTAASSHLIFGRIPEDVELRVFGVLVRVNGLESNDVAFKVKAGQPELEVKPSTATVLLPPGTGKGTIVIGGGTPPYVLGPLTWELDFLQPRLKGNIIDITGLAFRDVRLDVTDSSQPPQTVPAFVSVLEPRFFPTLTIIPHTLLAGTSPGYTIILRHGTDDMIPSRTEVTFGEHEVNLSRLTAGSTLGLGAVLLSGSLPQDFEAFFVTDDSSPDQVLFEASSNRNLTSGTIGMGSLQRTPPVLTLESTPEPPPESVVSRSLVQEILLDHGIFQLPQATDEPFEITVNLRSVTTQEGEDLPLTIILTSFLTTVGLPPGAPRIERLQPSLGSAGQLVHIQGSGFDPDPAGNRVSFEGTDGERVQVAVQSATTNELQVRVPVEAVTGPLHVEVDGLASNDYQFFARFRPDAAVMFTEFEAGEPTAPVLFLRQFLSPRLARRLNQDLSFDSMGVFLNEGKIKTDTLESGQTVGCAAVVSDSDGNQTDYFLVYGGQETEGEQRHVFELRLNPASTVPNGTLWMWQEEEGIRFELVLDFIFLGGSSMTIQVDESIYVPPSAAGTTVETRVEVRSVPWNFFGEQMVVVFPGEVETQ